MKTMMYRMCLQDWQVKGAYCAGAGVTHGLPTDPLPRMEVLLSVTIAGATALPFPSVAHCLTMTPKRALAKNELNNNGSTESGGKTDWAG